MEQLVSTTEYRRDTVLFPAIAISRRTALTAVLLFCVLAPCCTSRYLADRGAAVGQLTTHEREYQSLAEEWDKGRWQPGFMFCNFRDGDYRWGGEFISRERVGYSVGKGTNAQKKVGSIEDAAKMAGTDPATLRHWIDLTSRLYVYSIESRVGYPGVVEIMLRGSDWAPYGFRYAVEGNADALAALQHYSAVGGMENTDTHMDHAQGRWFYFEARR